MNRSINDLVIEALTEIREFPVEEAPQTIYINQGIRVYNLIKDSFSASGAEIPFFTSLDFPIAAGKKLYKIGLDPLQCDVIALPPVEFNSAFLLYNGTQWPIKVWPYSQRDSLGLLSTLTAVPSVALFQRQPDFTEIEFFPIPVSSYPFTMRFKGELPDAENEDQIKAIPPCYHRYLILKMGKQLSWRFPTAQWLPDMEAELIKEEAKFTITNDIDLGLEVSGQLQNNRGYYDPSSIFRGN